MIVETYGLDENVDLVFDKNPQWLSFNRETLQEISAIDQIIDDRIIFQSFANNDFYIAGIAKVIENYISEFSNDDVKYQGDFGLALKKLVEKFIDEKAKIKASFYKVINKKWNLASLNRKFWNQNFVPLSFQLEHAQMIISKKDSANFSSPGAGKTIITYMAVASLLANQEIDDLIVFGPKSASIAWTEEWKMVIDPRYVNRYNVETLNFAERSKNQLRNIKAKNLINEKLNIWFINFHKLNDSEFLTMLLGKVKKRKIMLVIDEAHYIKNIKGRWHQNLVILSAKAQYVLILSGTPIPRRAGEAHYIPNIIWPDIDHSPLTKEAFLEFEKNGEDDNLKNHFKKIYSKINKSELVKTGALREMIKEDVVFPINEVEQYLITNIKSSGSSGNILEEKSLAKMNKALLIRRMQASSYPPLLKTPLQETIEELKEDLLDYLEDSDNSTYDQETKEMIDEAAIRNQVVEKELKKLLNNSDFNNLINDYQNNLTAFERWHEALKIIKQNNQENIIVWDIFRGSMLAFRNFLKSEDLKRQIFLINGSIKGKERLKIINQFKESKNAILIASPATIAESVSLHKNCHKAIYLYKNYIGSHWMQSQDRIHRLVGPNEKSYAKIIYNLIANENSIDQLIMANLEDKVRQQAELID